MDRLQQQLDFILEIDKEKKIKRQTLLSDGLTFEDDAQHAWHMCVMTLLLSEYSNEKIDVLKTISMLLIHDLVEIDAGDTYAYDEKGIETQSEREKKAADRIFNLLPSDQAQKIMDLWLEFEAYETPESKFAHTMDNFQPCMLNAHTNGKMWKEKKVHLKSILKRNKKTSQGSDVLWNYMYTNYIQPNVKVSNIILDEDKSQ